MNAKDKLKLERLLDDFETGWIANPNGTAESNRNRHEKWLRSILEKVNKREIVSNKGE